MLLKPYVIMRIRHLLLLVVTLASVGQVAPNS